MKTHYDVLGVPFGADYDTIKAAYRKALKTYHPDLHEGDAGAERLSKQIIDAHAVLKDPDQRALYDEYILHYRQQRRRLFLIAMLLSAGLACGGTLFFLQPSLNSEATTAPPSGRFITARASAIAPAGGTEHLAKVERLSATVALPSSEMAALAAHEISDPPSYINVAPQPPRDVADAATPSITAALPPTKIVPSATLVPSPPTDIANAERVTAPAATPTSSIAADAPRPVTVAPVPPTGFVEIKNPSPPAAPSPSETDDPASDVTVVPTPPRVVTEPAHNAAAAAPAEKFASASAQPETAWAEIEKLGSAEDVLKFIQGHPGNPVTTLAQRRLEELIETSEDVASLEAVRVIATEPIASKVRVRLDRLAASKEIEEIIAGALPKEGGEAQQSEIAITSIPEAGAAPEETTDQTAGITPRDPKKHIKKGLVFLKTGDHELAIASFTNAILLDPPNAEYHLHRAAAWEAMRDLDNALADYDAAVRLDQTNIATFRARGLLWHRRGEVERALADLDRAIRLSFSDAKLYRDRGMIWYEMGRYNRAIADFTHAIRLDPNFASAYVSRGQAFQKKGDPVTAAINFEKAVSRDPAIGKAYRDLLHGPEKGERKGPQASR